MALAASISWSLGSYFRQPARAAQDGFVAATWKMLSAGVILLVLGVASGELWSMEPSRFSLRVGARVALSRDLRHPGRVHRLHLAAAGAPISKVVTHQYVNPIVAIALGALLLGEEITLAVGVGAALIVGSVFVAVRSENAAAGKRRSSGSPRSELLLRIGPSEARVLSRRSRAR